MTIYVSELGISSNNPYSSSNSRVGYVSMNERLNQAPVDRVKGVGSATDSRSSRGVAEKARQDYVAENNPAYTIDFSSAGKALIQNMKLMKSNSESLAARSSSLSAKSSFSLTADTDSRKNETVGTEENSTGSLSSAGSNASVNGNIIGEGIGATEDTETTSSSSTSTAVLSQYTEYQLSRMVSEGTITQAQMNRELSSRSEASESVQAASTEQSQLMRQAVNAYSYQMNFANTMF